MVGRSAGDNNEKKTLFKKWKKTKDDYWLGRVYVKQQKMQRGKLIYGNLIS